MFRLLSIGDWWGGMGTYEQVLYVVAFIASLILAIQLILALFGFARGADADIGGDISGDGAGDAGGADADADIGGDIHAGHGHGDAGAGLRIFTLQGIVGFFVMYSWSCIAFMAAGAGELASTLIATVLGAGALFLMAKITQWMLKLQESGNIELEGAKGASAQVYIPIPPEEGGIGKVTLTLQSRFIECNAVTRGKTLLRTDSFVRVTEVRDNLLVVEADPDGKA